jgi:hypothetical protein
MGSLVEQTAQQMPPRFHETRIRRRDSRLAHRDSGTGHSFHSPRNRIERMQGNKKPGKFPCRALLVNQLTQASSLWATTSMLSRK